MELLSYLKTIDVRKIDRKEERWDVQAPLFTHLLTLLTSFWLFTPLLSRY
jgi:hypothetical protein